MPKTGTSKQPSAWKLWLVGIIVGLLLLQLPSGFIVDPLRRLIFPTRTALEYAVLEVNGRPVNLAPGQVTAIRPLDNIKLTGVNADLQNDPELTVEGEGFDASVLLSGGRAVDLLPMLNNDQTFKLVFLRGLSSLGWVGLQPLVLPVDLVLLAGEVEGRSRIDLLEQASARSDKANPLLLGGMMGAALALGDTARAADFLAARLELVFSTSDLDAYAGMRQSLGQTRAEAEALDLLARLGSDASSVAERMLTAAEKLSDREMKVNALQRLARAAPGARSVEALKRLGYTYVQAGEWDQAADTYAQAARLDPRDANIQANLAVIHAKRGDKAARRAALTALVRLRPDDVDSLRELARTASKEEAPLAWRKVLDLLPRDEEALMALIAVLADEPPSAELADYYSRLARLKPGEAVIHFNLGQVLVELSRLEEARRSLAEAARLTPDDADPLWVLFDIDKRSGDPGAATATAARLLALEPGNIDLYRYLYKNLAAAGERDRLEEILRRGVKAVPESAELWKLLALNRLAVKDSKGAIRALVRVVKLEPDDVPNRLRLARLYEDADNKKAALNQYRAVLDRDPENDEAGPAYLRLKMGLLKKRN